MPTPVLGHDEDFLLIANEGAFSLDFQELEEPWTDYWSADTLWSIGQDAFESIFGSFTTLRRMTLFLATQVTTLTHLGMVHTDSVLTPKFAPRHSPDPCFPDTTQWPTGEWRPAFMAGRVPINELDEVMAATFPDDTQAARDATLPALYGCFQDRATQAFMVLRQRFNVSMPPPVPSLAPDMEDAAWVVDLGLELPVGLILATQVRVDTGARVKGGSSLDSKKTADLRALWNAVITAASDGGGMPAGCHLQSHHYAVIIEPTPDGMSIVVTAWLRDEPFTSMAAFTEALAQRSHS